MKKTLGYVMVIAMLFAMVFAVNVGGAASAAADETLTVYNWGDYIDKSVLDDFVDYYKDATGKTLEIKYPMFDTNEIMYAEITKQGSAVDLVCPSEYMIEKLLKEDLLAPLDFSLIPDAANVDSKIITKIDEIFSAIPVGTTANTVKMTDYMVPYMWGTLGILYNAEKITREEAEEAGYGLLWNITELKGVNKKIYMKDSVRDAYCAAVFYLKEQDKLPEKYKNYTVTDLMNTVDDELLALAEEAFKEQKGVLKDYEVDNGKNEMLTGKGLVNLAWSGDALYAIDEADVELDYFVPAIGGNVWFDGWAMLKNAPNKTAAQMFINYMCNPEVAMKNSVEIGYSSAISEAAIRADADACAYLEENGYDLDEYFANEIRYPNMDSANLGVMRDFGAKSESAIEMWERVKSYGMQTWVLIVIIVGVVVVVGGVVAFFLLRGKKGTKKKIS